MQVDALALSALIIATLALFIGSMALIFLIGLKTSTHRIEYVDPLAATGDTQYEYDIPPNKASEFPIHPEKEHLLVNGSADPQTMSREELIKYFSTELDEE
jgi:hypothetical protein